MPAIRLHVPGGDDAAETSVKAVVALYLDSFRSDARSYEERKRILNLFCDDFGQREVLDLAPDDLESWIQQRDGLRSNWTRRRWARTINACLNWAVRKRRLIPYNPLACVVFRTGKRGRPLTDSEFRGILIAATDRRFRRFVLFLRYTGCRPGEAASALWENLDVERCAIVLTEHKTAEATGEDRVIYLSPQAVRLLKLIDATDRSQGNIFVNAWGNPWARSALSNRLAHIRKVAKIPADAKLYGNRHRFCTDAILSGVDIVTLAQLVGHKGTKTTSHYLHLAGKDQHLREAVAKITRK